MAMSLEKHRKLVCVFTLLHMDDTVVNVGLEDYALEKALYVGVTVPLVRHLSVTCPNSNLLWLNIDHQVQVTANARLTGLCIF
jgi:hypothetical protein